MTRMPFPSPMWLFLPLWSWACKRTLNPKPSQVKAETEGEQKINNSYQGLYKQFVEFLRGLGVEAVSTVGQPFDPNFHEAIMKEPNNEVPPTK